MQADVLTDVAKAAFHSLLFYPARRYGTRTGRQEGAERKFADKLSDILPKFAERLTTRLAELSNSLDDGQEASSLVLVELEQWFRSAGLDSIARQAIAARITTGQSAAVQGKMLGPVSLSLRLEAPKAYALHHHLIKELAGLISWAINDLVDEMSLDIKAIGDADLANLLLESCKWQLDSIERSIHLVSQPGIRVDDFASFPDRYTTAVTTAFARLPTPHWDGEPRIPIAKVYVPAKFLTADSVEKLQLRLKMEHSRNFLNSPVTEPFADTSSRHAVLLGDPGAGKTSFMSNMVYNLAAQRTTVGAASRLPFVVTLRDYRKLTHDRGQGLTFTEYIADRCAEEYQVRAPIGAIEYALLAGGAITVFDGLDEILNVRERRQVAERIEIFVRLYPNCPVLVTSRISGYANTPLADDLFSLFIILPFDDAEVQRYVDSWFALDEDVSPGILQKNKTTFFDNIQRLDQRLYRNPLSLALLCNLSKANGYLPLPKSRAEIFEKCALMLYHRWDYRRGIGDVDFERDFLPVIAFAASRIVDDPALETGFTEQELVRLCISYLMPSKFDESDEAERYARSLIEHCVGRAWVFSAVGTNEDDLEMFNFTHRTFLEYFAALHLVRSNPTASALVETMKAWILRGERSLITQMAFEIKTRQLDGAAEDFSEELMTAAAQSGERGKAAAIEWLCEEASIVPIGQSVLRTIVHSATALARAERLVALGRLARARGENRRVIDREVIAFVNSNMAAARREGPDATKALQAIVDEFDKNRRSDELNPWRRLQGLFPKPDIPVETFWWQDG